MGIVVDKFDPDAFDNCITSVFKAIAAHLP